MCLKHLWLKKGLRMYQSNSNVLRFTYVQHSKLLSAALAKTGVYKIIQRFNRPINRTFHHIKRFLPEFSCINKTRDNNQLSTNTLWTVNEAEWMNALIKRWFTSLSKLYTVCLNKLKEDNLFQGKPRKQ